MLEVRASSRGIVLSVTPDASARRVPPPARPTGESTGATALEVNSPFVHPIVTENGLKDIIASA